MVFNQSRSFLSDMQNVYRISWTKMIRSCTGKLRTYSTFKNAFGLENYVLQFPLHVRRNLTKLRISAHSLAIETGRYAKNTSNQPDKRLCFHCKSIETEAHLVLECSLYSDLRNQFFKQLSQFSSIPFDLSNNTFCILMSCLNGDVEVGKIFCEYINSCFTKRREAFNCSRENEIMNRPPCTVTRYGRLSKRPNRIYV